MHFIHDKDEVSIKQGAVSRSLNKIRGVEQVKPQKPVCTCAPHIVVMQQWISDKTATIQLVIWLRIQR